MGICLVLGGSKLLPGWFGGTYAVEIEVQIKTFVKDCQDSSDFTNLVNSVELLFGQCPNNLEVGLS